MFVCVNHSTLVPPCITAQQIKTPFLKTLRGYLGAQAWRTLETLLQVGLRFHLQCAVAPVRHSQAGGDGEVGCRTPKSPSM